MVPSVSRVSSGAYGSGINGYATKPFFIILQELQGFPVFQGFPRVQRVSGGSGINTLATTEFLMFFKGFQCFEGLRDIAI